MRLFVGIALEYAVVSELSRVVARLKTGNDGLRWTTAETWHITLQFLGSTDPAQYECLLGQLGTLRAAPVPVKLERLGVFDRTGVFFAGVRAEPELVSLAKSVMARTSLCGFVAETRPFRPHITLARTKGGGRAGIMRALESKVNDSQPAFSRTVAEEFRLYESHLSSTGATYEVRARYPLAAR